jgi:hypothetical protein
MTGERRITFVRSAFPAPEDLADDRAWIIPPNFMRYAPEEVERVDHAGQDRLRALARIAITNG